MQKYKMNRFKNKDEKLPFYYRFFGMLKDNNINTIHARKTANDIGFKSPTSVARDLQDLIPNSGTKKYGYNVNYIYRVLQGSIDLIEPFNIVIIGNDIPFFHSEILPRRNLNLVGYMDDLDKTIFIENNISMIILNKDIDLETLKNYKEIIKCIINLTKEPLYTENIGIYVYNFDPCELFLNTINDYNFFTKNKYNNAVHD